MGLDMYMTAERFLSEHFQDEDVNTIAAIGKLFPELSDDTKPQTVIIEAAYWRKANAIHAWFVKNVQDGVDDCGKYYVAREQLQELMDSVNMVINDNSMADTLLPPQAGFFFGNTEVDDWYLQDMKSTKEMLEPLIANEGMKEKCWEFYYHSSW